MTKTITLTNAVIISITNYFASDDYWQNHNVSVSGSISWIIRKNKKEISKALELIKEAETELNEEYNTDEKSQYAKDEDGNDLPKTVISREYSSEWKPGDEPYYPVNDEKNGSLYQEYVALAQKEKNVLFGGRLGQYKYYDMDKVIRAALTIMPSWSISQPKTTR